MLESETKRRCCDQLKKWGWLVVHIIQCSLNGWPDTQIYRAGRMVFIEFKQPGKEPGPLQKYRHEKLRQQGFEVYVITSVEQISQFK